MSFSQDVKVEIAAKRIQKTCCITAACYGIACFSKYFDARGIVLQTETEAVAGFAKKMYGRCGVAGSVLVKERTGSTIYEFSVKEEGAVRRLLQMLHSTGNETHLRIRPQLLQCPGCVSAFLAAAFLCSGTVSDPAKDYHLEFLTPRFNLSRDVEGLLAEHEFRPHRTLRKGANIVYVKASEPIENLLTFMGAGNAAMRMMDEKLVKDIRNKTNRLSNCETANMDKAIQAKVQAEKAIRYLAGQDALTSLPAPLREAAEKRLQYPDCTLAQLAEKFNPPISKSGLSHRLKKLQELAHEHQQRKEHV